MSFLATGTGDSQFDGGLWLWAAVIALSFAVIAQWRLWRQTKGIQRLIRFARALVRGEISGRINVHGQGVASQMAVTMNEMREHLARQLATIDRQRQSIGSLVGQLREGVIVSGPDSRLVLVNPEAKKLLRIQSPRTDGSFEGLTLERCIPQHDLQELLQVRENGSAEGSQELRETRLQVDGPDGSISLLARACDILLPGQDEGMESPSHGRLLVLTDVTELARTIQVKADFAANASHELRTPLSAILAAAETIRTMDGDFEPASIHRWLDVIERHGKRMQAMVVDLLDLSRLESASARFEPRSVNSREVFREIEDTFHEEIVAKGLRWSVSVGPGCETVNVHPELLRITLRNLVENSVRFTPNQGQISIGVAREAKSALFTVSDTGCGIPKEEQERVFERFYQVARSRSGSERGTGLGLSIVRHAVSAMEATIELNSELGKGTVVAIRVPQFAAGELVML